ncbi:hypothetical protein [Macrococcoides canis]|uniref:hypothetical protein n=1 Tax=Macrococcoides canis TaxID=1855823 RepID=UPI00140E9366|nr:hypothetical protein [Macrococcus canis]
MANQKDDKVRITGYITEDTYDLITKIQKEVRLSTGKKPTYGDVIDEIAKKYNDKK